MQPPTCIVLTGHTVQTVTAASQVLQPSTVPSSAPKLATPILATKPKSPASTQTVLPSSGQPARLVDSPIILGDLPKPSLPGRQLAPAGRIVTLHGQKMFLTSEGELKPIQMGRVLPSRTIAPSNGSQKTEQRVQYQYRLLSADTTTSTGNCRR